VNLGVVQEAEPLEVRVVQSCRDVVALREVPLGFVQQPPLRAHHAEVVVRDGAPVLVVATPIGLEGARVARQRALEVALNGREDAEILLDAGPQLAARATELHRAKEVAPRFGQGAQLEVDDAEGIQRLGREDIIARGPSFGSAPRAQLTRLRRLVAAMLDHRELPEPFRQYRLLARVLGGMDR